MAQNSNQQNRSAQKRYAKNTPAPAAAGPTGWLPADNKLDWIASYNPLSSNKNSTRSSPELQPLYAATSDDHVTIPVVTTAGSSGTAAARKTALEAGEAAQRNLNVGARRTSYYNRARYKLEIFWGVARVPLMIVALLSVVAIAVAAIFLAVKVNTILNDGVGGLAHTTSVGWATLKLAASQDPDHFGTFLGAPPDAPSHEERERRIKLFDNAQRPAHVLSDAATNADAADVTNFGDEEKLMAYNVAQKMMQGERMFEFVRQTIGDLAMVADRLGQIVELDQIGPIINTVHAVVNQVSVEDLPKVSTALPKVVDLVDTVGGLVNSAGTLVRTGERILGGVESGEDEVEVLQRLRINRISPLAHIATAIPEQGDETATYSN